MNIQIIYLIFQKTWTGTFNGTVLGQHVSGPGLDSQTNKKQNKTKNPQVKDFKFYSYSMYGLIVNLHGFISHWQFSLSIYTQYLVYMLPFPTRLPSQVEVIFGSFWSSLCCVSLLQITCLLGASFSYVCVCMYIHVCIHVCVYVCIHNPLVLWDMGSNYFSIEPGNYGVSC